MIINPAWFDRANTVDGATGRVSAAVDLVFAQIVACGCVPDSPRSQWMEALAAIPPKDVWRVIEDYHLTGEALTVSVFVDLAEVLNSEPCGDEIVGGGVIASASDFPIGVGHPHYWMYRLASYGAVLHLLSSFRGAFAKSRAHVVAINWHIKNTKKIVLKPDGSFGVGASNLFFG